MLILVPVEEVQEISPENGSAGGAGGLGGGEGGLLGGWLGGSGGGGLGGGDGGSGGIDGAGIIMGAVSTTTSMPFAFVRKVSAFAGISILVAGVTVRAKTHVLLAAASASVSGAAISAVTLTEAAVTVACQPPHART